MAISCYYHHNKFHWCWGYNQESNCIRSCLLCCCKFDGTGRTSEHIHQHLSKCIAIKTSRETQLITITCAAINVQLVSSSAVTSVAPQCVSAVLDTVVHTQSTLVNIWDNSQELNTPCVYIIFSYFHSWICCWRWCSQGCRSRSKSRECWCRCAHIGARPHHTRGPLEIYIKSHNHARTLNCMCLECMIT